jgi:Flp pilus assembly protein TadB
MVTNHKREAGSLLVVAALVLILVAVGFGRGSGNERANAAWSERMTQQAEYLQERALAARAADAWSARLTGLAELEGKVPEQKAAGMSDRAIAAWSARLTGLAEYLAAK